MSKLNRNHSLRAVENILVMVAAIEDFGSETITGIMKEIYESGHMQISLRRSILIALYKIPGASNSAIPPQPNETQKKIMIQILKNKSCIKNWIGIVPF